jgi:hypothetical protein
MMNIDGGMRLAPNQPPPGYSVNHRVADPKHHRLGLIKMKVGSDHSIRHPETKARMHLTVRDASQFSAAGAVIVCLHPACEGRVFEAEKGKEKEQDTPEKIIAAAHPSKRDMVASGERHVWGLFSPAAMEKDSGAPKIAKLLVRAEAFLKVATKAADDAKDLDEVRVAIEKLELAEKNVAALKKMASERRMEIVGLLSDDNDGT